MGCHHCSCSHLIGMLFSCESLKGRELKELLNSPIAIQTFISQLDNAAAVEVLHALANRLQDEAKKTAAHQ
jgi:hypothetical protein